MAMSSDYSDDVEHGVEAEAEAECRNIEDDNVVFPTCCMVRRHVHFRPHTTELHCTLKPRYP